MKTAPSEKCTNCGQLDELKQKDADEALCRKCRKMPRCDACRKRKNRVISSHINIGKSYCGPCMRRRGG